MKGYSIKSQLWKNVIIKTYSFNNCISIVIHMCFTPFGELLTKGLFKSLVYTINPTACCLSPLFYNCCLRLCSLTLSFKTAF